MIPHFARLLLYLYVYQDITGRNLYVGNDLSTCLVELSEEQFVRTRSATWQALHRGQHYRPRGRLFGLTHHQLRKRLEDLSILGNAVTSDSDGP